MKYLACFLITWLVVSASLNSVCYGDVNGKESLRYKYLAELVDGLLKDKMNKELNTLVSYMLLDEKGKSDLLVILNAVAMPVETQRKALLGLLNSTNPAILSETLLLIDGIYIGVVDLQLEQKIEKLGHHTSHEISSKAMRCIKSLKKQRNIKADKNEK